MVSRIQKIVLASCGLILILLFQNCSNEVIFENPEGPTSQGLQPEGDFPNAPITNEDNPVEDVEPVGEIELEEEDDEPVVSNPFIDDVVEEPSSGLRGQLKYFDPEIHTQMFDGKEKNHGGETFIQYSGSVVLDDLLTFGIKAPVSVVMGQINVPAQSFDSGFRISDNEFLTYPNSDEVILEWFALDLEGQISLPDGRYQFATLSDDGIRVKVDGATLINNPSQHAPKLDCASELVEFQGEGGENQARAIELDYFQGPRHHIALVLYAKKIEDGEQAVDCNVKKHHHDHDEEDAKQALIDSFANDVVPATALSN